MIRALFLGIALSKLLLCLRFVLHAAIYNTLIHGGEAIPLVEMRHSLVKMRHFALKPAWGAAFGTTRRDRPALSEASGVGRSHWPSTGCDRLSRIGPHSQYHRIPLPPRLIASPVRFLSSRLPENDKDTERHHINAERLGRTGTAPAVLAGRSTCSSRQIMNELPIRVLMSEREQRFTDLVKAIVGLVAHGRVTVLTPPSVRERDLPESAAAQERDFAILLSKSI